MDPQHASSIDYLSQLNIAKFKISMKTFDFVNNRLIMNIDEGYNPFDKND